jgi:hypothetical protein
MGTRNRSLKDEVRKNVGNLRDVIYHMIDKGYCQISDSEYIVREIERAN